MSKRKSSETTAPTTPVAVPSDEPPAVIILGEGAGETGAPEITIETGLEAAPVTAEEALEQAEGERIERSEAEALPPPPGELLSFEEIESMNAPPAHDLPTDETMPPVLIDGQLPGGWEWYGNESGMHAPRVLGESHSYTETHDGRVVEAHAPELFPPDMFHDRDEPGRRWTERGWEFDGAPSSPPVGHTVCGVPGTPFEGYFFVWCEDGADGGRWARRVRGE